MRTSLAHQFRLVSPVDFSALVSRPALQYGLGALVVHAPAESLFEGELLEVGKRLWTQLSYDVGHPCLGPREGSGRHIIAFGAA